MTTSYDEIPHLLHEAQLIDVEWDRDLSQLKLVFDCLRRNEDGSVMNNSSVELLLKGVTGIASFHSPANFEVRPSKVTIPDSLSEAELTNWEHPPVESVFCVNSKHRAFEMETACRIDWLLRPPLESGPRLLDVHVLFEPRSYADNAIETGLFIRCTSIQSMAGGVPLDMDQWRRQFEEWWRGWERHWDEESSSIDENESPSVEDTFIPVGADPVLDLSYRPPDEPAFVVADTDAPMRLLSPIKEYHEGHHTQEWSRMARAYPNLDTSVAERAAQLESQSQGPDFGRWFYVRHVDSWWQEGPRACVVVRGIEHRVPDEEDPAGNEETVISYGLRRSGDDWLIFTWSQGWPRHGSAPEASESASWREGWDLP